ncbi:MAG: hypothetical protein ACT4OX_01070 [Actinomycetota bacterium]
MLVELVVTAGKKEQSRSHAFVDDTKVSAHPGPAARPADVVFTVTPVDAQALRDCTLDLSVGFMRGQVKMAGDFNALLRLLRLTAGAEPAVKAADLLTA